MRRLISILIKLVAVISGIYGLISVFNGPMFLTYFTNLSNIFVVIMLIIFLIKEIILKKEVVNTSFLVYNRYWKEY